jgi:hypothetical protein
VALSENMLLAYFHGESSFSQTQMAVW